MANENSFNHFEGINPTKLIAIQGETGKKVHASKVDKKDGPFYCPDTYDPLIVRKCYEKRDHFAYWGRLSPTGSRESDIHLNCKHELLHCLRESIPDGNWEVERVLNAIPEKNLVALRPDISGRIGESKVIVEVQASRISLDTIVKRSVEYSRRGGSILWLVPLTSSLGEENFRPRFFERFLHAMFFGRIYYWCKGDGLKITPVHFGNAERYIEYKTWFQDGEEKESGGYSKYYVSIKKPLAGQKVDLISCFNAQKRNQKLLNNEKIIIPESTIWMDNLKKWW